jgi:predicted ATPase
MQQANPGNPKKPIVLTGAWGGGKTTVLSELAAERGRYCILAEAAPSARSAGHDPSSPEFERHVVELQHSMEEAALRSADGYEAVLTHRGSLDALAFWRLQSNPAERFFEMIGSSHSEELERYRAVILLQSAAQGALDRYLSYAEEKKRPPAGEAVILEQFLEEAWREHPCFFSIANEGTTWERKSRCAKAIVNAHSSGAERPSLRDVNSRLEAITYPSTHQYMLDEKRQMIPGFRSLPRLEAIGEALQGRRFDSLLDIGSGKGMFIIWACRHFNLKRAVALEVRTDMAEACRAAIECAGLKATVVQASLPDFRCALIPADLVFVLHSYHYLYFGSYGGEVTGTWNHSDIFRTLASLCSDTVVFANDLSLPPGKDLFWREKGVPESVMERYNEAEIMSCAAGHFEICRTDHGGGRPVILMKKRR